MSLVDWAVILTISLSCAFLLATVAVAVLVPYEWIMRWQSWKTNRMIARLVRRARGGRP